MRKKLLFILLIICLCQDGYADAPRLYLTLEGPSQCKPGDILTFHLQVRNVSGSLTIQYHMPEGVRFYGAQNHGIYDDPHHQILWSDVRSGQDLGFAVKVEQYGPPSLENACWFRDSKGTEGMSNVIRISREQKISKGAFHIEDLSRDPPKRKLRILGKFNLHGVKIRIDAGKPPKDLILITANRDVTDNCRIQEKGKSILIETQLNLQKGDDMYLSYVAKDSRERITVESREGWNDSLVIAGKVRTTPVKDKERSRSGAHRTLLPALLAIALAELIYLCSQILKLKQAGLRTMIMSLLSMMKKEREEG